MQNYTIYLFLQTAAVGSSSGLTNTTCCR